jgi:hypothetical protein
VVMLIPTSGCNRVIGSGSPAVYRGDTFSSRVSRNA